MRKVLSPIFIFTFILTLGIGSIALAGCGSSCCSKGKAQKASAHHCAETAGVEGMTHEVTENATMDKVLTSKKLYACPDHSSVISVHKEHSCPLDKKPLEKLSRKEAKQLRGQELYGCTMCPVIKTAADEDLHCTMCGMDLVKVEIQKKKG